ncbi:MAG: glycosyl hydrolase 115 family protein [Ferruginibacter sp.]
MKNKNFVSLLLACLFPATILAVGDSGYVSTVKGNGYFTLSAQQISAPLYIDAADYPGVIRALNDLKTDIGKVAGYEPSIYNGLKPTQKEIVIVGTIGKSALIDALIKSKKINVSSITGKWEHFLIQTISNPFPGVEKALVIVGSDKRGTIYGIYDVSEQIGVSPWYFWADVPVEHKDALYIKPVKFVEGPSVKYRGIFINDEAPDLTSWVKDHYGLAKANINPPVGNNVANYNHEFYSKTFEFLLRIKANYLWPAMWSNAFNEDDSENPRLADEYGIVMGTSHQEPMVRSQQEWDRRYIKTLGNWNYKKHADTLASFWREGIRRNKKFESIVTMGLRGANDTQIEGTLDENIGMVQNIVQVQQNIIKEEMGVDLNKVPQVWCLYKEIMEYYNGGMRVPGNITLLWADDNWGNIRRLPNDIERKRSGGAGVYYHFDYHGDPRSYEWINTNPLPKIWDQMHLAKEYGADKVWIVNVGHFRGYELPMEYFMSLAWNTDKWKSDNTIDFTRNWAAREFGKEYSNDIAHILSTYGKFNGRCKPESLRPDTYSLINYNEAENIVTEYNNILHQAEAIYNKLPAEKKDAFYQIVLFPVKASAQINELYVTAGKNALYADQQRASTNKMAARTREFFTADTSLMSYYNHQFAAGKWNHFMDETHIGHTNWAPPRLNNLNAIPLKEITVPDAAAMGVSVEGSMESWPGSSTIATLPALDIFSNQKHYIDIFNKGKNPFQYNITANVPWLVFSEMKGRIDSSDRRIWISINQAKLPKGNQQAEITISSSTGKVLVKVNAFSPVSGNKNNIKGFVESAGFISIEAEHFAKNIANGNREWLKIEDYGLTLSGMRATAPANAAAAKPGMDAPCLEYPLYLFSSDTAEITLITSPLLNVMPDRDIKLAVSIDDGTPSFVTNVPDKFKVHWSNPAWALTVVKQARRCTTTIKLPNTGKHTLKIWMVDPGVVLEKILINTGGLSSSRLGAPESYFAK